MVSGFSSTISPLRAGGPRHSVCMCKLVSRRGIRGTWRRYLRSGVCVSTHGVFGSRQRRTGKYSVSPWHGGSARRSVARPESDRTTSTASTSATACRSRGDPPSCGYTPPPSESPACRAMSCLAHRVRHDEHPDDAYSCGLRHIGSPLQVCCARKEMATSSSPWSQRHLKTFRACLLPMTQRLWLRFHPAASQHLVAGERVVDASDAALEKRGLTFYELLAESEGLITDYTSLWVDYLVLDRPVIGAMPDADRYLRERAMSLEPYETWFPGPVIRDSAQLCEQINAVLEGSDPDSARRGFLAAAFHPLQDTDASVAIWRDIALMREHQ